MDLHTPVRLGMSSTEATRPSIPIWHIQDAPGNIMMVPQLRGGCHRWKSGWHGRKHSHDGAVEVFLVMEGQCDFDVDGQQFTLYPQQFVMIPAEVPHEMWNRTDQDLLMFLVVAPHQQPTHTYYDEAGQPIRSR